MDIDCDLKRLYYFNRSLHDPWHSIFMGLYIILTITSLVSNLLLLIALYRFNNNRLRHQNRLSSQNLLIRPLKPGEITRDRLVSHLAILDIFLSLTIPMTAFDGLSKFWPLGKNTQILCQVTKSSPSIVVYWPTMMISNISLPISYEAANHNQEEIDSCDNYDQFGWSHVVFCIEEWPFGEEF